MSTPTQIACRRSMPKRWAVHYTPHKKGRKQKGKEFATNQKYKNFIFILNFVEEIYISNLNLMLITSYLSDFY